MGKKSSWNPIIGLEVHVELKTKSKMFCSCPNKHFNQKPNTQTCPLCLGLPGALPVANKKAIEAGIIIALALDCQINKNFWFDRKNYFYPDLPKGYQISQHFSPLGIKGRVPFLINGQFKKIGISDVHLEEDTAKLIHEKSETLIDFNRSGVPLLEIVSQPEIHSSEEAKAYLKRIQQTIRWLGLSDCDMEKGSMRLEVNISLNQNPNQLPNYKVEIKNLNSFRFAEKAIDYEIKRQTSLLEKGAKLKQETRGFNSEKGVTYIQRIKESAKEYRYFPEPDLPPFKITDPEIKKLKKAISDLPWLWEEKIIKAGIPWPWTQIICQTREKARLFWQAKELDPKISPRKIANWLVNKPAAPGIGPRKLITLIKQETAKFDLTEKEILKTVKEVVKENPKAAEDYRNGKTQAIGFLIGQIQRKTKGKAEPKLTAELIKNQLVKN